MVQAIVHDPLSWPFILSIAGVYLFSVLAFFLMWRRMKTSASRNRSSERDSDGEQATEAVHWITGDYSVVENATYGGVLGERGLDQLTAARGIPNDEFCLNSSCHDITRDDLKQMTADRARNPHNEQHGKQDCTNCHKAHRASVFQCAQCHNDVELPDGWITPAQANKLV